MQPETKKLGEMLVEAGLITPDQLQDALRHQRIAGGRMGSNLVALGFVSEDMLMDFLAHKTGVPRLDMKGLDVPVSVLQRIPRRLADQLNVLPVAFKEPKSLILAMADPSDLNAIDSARFASGLNIEPMVSSYSALKVAIGEQYRKVDGPNSRTIEVAPSTNLDEGLPVPFTLNAPPLEVKSSAPPIKEYGFDPFFDPTGDPGHASNPFSFFTPEVAPEPVAEPQLPQGIVPGTPMIIHARSTGTPPLRRIESFDTRTLLLGLVRLLQRRGVVGDDELQRFLVNLLDAGELQENERPE